MKKITVIIICYNSELTLAKAISSVCRQTYPNLEILVVDDGSTDRSAEIADRFARADSRIRVIPHKENRGILAARKTGVENAGGDYIMHLDADDELEPDACARAEKAIDNLRVDFVQFGTRVIADPSVSAAEILLKQKKLNVNSLMLDYSRQEMDYAILNACFCEHKFTYTQWNKIYRADLLKKAFGCLSDKRINMGEDMYCLFVVMSIAKSMAVIEEQLYDYHFGKGVSCASAANPMKAFLNSCETMKSVQAVREYIDSNPEVRDAAPYVSVLRMEMLKRTATRFYPLLPDDLKNEADLVLRKLWTEEELALYLPCEITAA